LPGTTYGERECRRLFLSKELGEFLSGMAWRTKSRRRFAFYFSKRASRVVAWNHD